jgi:leader peptidase (prepilin peptidase)/N-methyltransferase
VSTAAAAVCAGVLGALIGSFLNVVIWRLPRGESVVSPPSACPKCGAQIKPYDNIPVLSWLILRGKCRNCGNPISARYPLIEGLTAVLMALVPICLGVDDDQWIGYAMVLILVPLTFIDLDHRILPNKITYPSVPIAIGLTAAFDVHHLVAHLIAGAAAFGFLFAAAWIYPAGMGVGDVKLAGVLGLFLGRAVAPALLIAFLLGTVVGIGVMAVKGVKAGRKTAIPFGPFLSIGGLIGLYVGDDIVDWYLDTFTRS